MAFDEHGRLYVVEMHDYSEDAEGSLGVIHLLTDTDGDGRFDTSSVFADKLSWPTAVICYDGGIFVGRARHSVSARTLTATAVPTHEKSLHRLRPRQRARAVE